MEIEKRNRRKKGNNKNLLVLKHFIKYFNEENVQALKQLFYHQMSVYHVRLLHLEPKVFFANERRSLKMVSHFKHFENFLFATKWKLVQMN